MKERGAVFKLFAVLVFAVAAAGCSPREADDQKVTDAGPAGPETELKEEQYLTPLLPPALYDDQVTQAVPEPPPVDYFEYLDFSRKTYSDIRIWGWSRDGKVAYSDNISAEGGWFRVYIFDMVNDTTIWRDSIDLLAYYLSIEHDEDFNFYESDFYLDFINEYKKACVQNGIEFIQTEFTALPVRHNNETVNIILEKNESSLGPEELTEWPQYGGTVESYTVIAENNGKRKVIHERTFTVYANDVFVCGCFVSPFENRALIVIGEFAHGWEESVVDYSLIGCHLSLGF